MLGALLLGTACAAPDAPLTEYARVAQGELRGRTDGDVLRFRDVSFAAPRVGALRWRPPEAAPAWDGIRDAAGPARAWADVVTDRAYACPALATYRALAARGPLYAYEFADRSAPSPLGALPGDLADGAAHGAEVPTLLDLVPGPREDDPAGLVGSGPGSPPSATLAGRPGAMPTTPTP